MKPREQHQAVRTALVELFREVRKGCQKGRELDGHGNTQVSFDFAHDLEGQPHDLAQEREPGKERSAWHWYSEARS
jgi:hypothetical protein